jgi:hypothetical protein
LLKASRFGDFLRSTLSWWLSVKISASSEALDRNSPMTAYRISLRGIVTRNMGDFRANWLGDEGPKALKKTFELKAPCAVHKYNPRT